MQGKAARTASADLVAALGLLTRLPVPSRPPRGAGAWAFPVAGLAIGAIAALAAWLALAMGVPSALAAVIAIGVQVVVTGALHEDGLADVCDGFWGGWNRMRRLEIMKDSRIGTYGFMGLGLVTLARWSALGVLLQAGWIWAPLLAVAAVSRAPMVVLMVWLPNARGTGLSQSVGRPKAATAGIAALVALAVLMLAKGPVVLPIVTVALATLLAASVAQVKIGGQTGDVLGAVQQLSEVALLTCFAASVT